MSICLEYVELLKIFNFPLQVLTSSVNVQSVTSPS